MADIRKMFESQDSQQKISNQRRVRSKLRKLLKVQKEGTFVDEPFGHYEDHKQETSQRVIKSQKNDLIKPVATDEVARQEQKLQEQLDKELKRKQEEKEEFERQAWIEEQNRNHEQKYRQIKKTMGNLEKQNKHFLGQLAAFRNGRKTEAKEKHQVISSFTKTTSKAAIQPDSEAVDMNWPKLAIGFNEEIPVQRHGRNLTSVQTLKGRTSETTLLPQIGNPSLAGSIKNLKSSLYLSPNSHSMQSTKFKKGVKSSTGKIEFTGEIIDTKIDSMHTFLLDKQKQEQEAAVDPRALEYVRDYHDLFVYGKPQTGLSSKYGKRNISQ